MDLMQLMKQEEISIAELAKKLDISVSQIYKWNKEGISQNNKHYKQLQSILPGLQPREPTLRQDGTEDRRYKSGKPKDNGIPINSLADSSHHPAEPEFQSTLFPKIIKRRQT